jgi:predicted amidohydrolase YtcJ
VLAFAAMMATNGADLVLVGAVYTAGSERRWAGAVAVAGDRIVAVGTENEVRDRVGTAAHIVTGAAVLPAFQDAHVHPSVGGRNLLNVNLDDLSTKDEYLARIRSFAEANPDLSWIVGGGWYNPVFLATQGPRKEDLDAVVPDRPAFLLNTDVHAGWANSKALEAAGISAESADPWDGYAVRDLDGSPTGCLQEGAAYDMLRNVIPRPDVGTWEECLRVAQRELHGLGITGWQDAWVEPDLLRAYRALDDAGALTARVVTALWWDRHRGIEQVDDLLEQREWGTAGNVHAGTIKIMLDGCPESCTASMLAPYEGAFGEEHGTGIQFVGQEQLTEAVVRLDTEGFQVHQHALGDRAIRSALDAIEVAREQNGGKDLRHHVAHLQLPDPADLPRLRQLGAAANVQPYWAQPDLMIEEMTRPRVGDRASRLYPIGDVRASGAVMAFGSDWPVSTPNPWLEIEVAVTRQSPGDGSGRVLDASQRIDLADAIGAFTQGAAYVNHDDGAGSIAEGKRADLVVVDRNPFAGAASEIHETNVTMTLAAGKAVYESG